MTTAPVGCLDGEQAIRDALAAGPDAGPWFAQRDYSMWTIRNAEIARNGFQQRLASVGSPGRTTTKREPQNVVNAAYIAACHPETMRALLAELDRLRSASRQEGWQLVPVEPTPEMLAAGAECWHISKDNADGYYRAMLAAAPHQAQEAQGDRHGE